MITDLKHTTCRVEEKLHEENMQKYVLRSATCCADKVVDDPVEIRGTISPSRLVSVLQLTSVQRRLDVSVQEGH